MIIAFLNIGVTELLILLPFLALFIFALYKCLSNKSLRPFEKIIWVLVIFSIPILGALAYLVTNRNS